MADLVYVNVGGTWKTVNRYYVNVNGTWKTGNTIQGNIGGTWSSLLGGFPTATQVGTLDYAEFGAVPRVYVDSKQAVSSDGLDNPYFGCKPYWTRDSDFVYSAPGGGTPPPSILPTYSSNSFGLDGNIEFTALPTVYTSTKSTVDGTTSNYLEYTAKPVYTQENTVGAYTPPSGGGSQTSILPTKTNILTLDLNYFGCKPLVRVAAKSGIDTSNLDYAEFQANPYYTTPA